MLADFPSYRVQPAARKPLLEFVTRSLEAARCRIIKLSSPNIAPFVVSWETAAGERMGAVLYAFLATRTPTKNRPSDERSFQIKYGGKADDNTHNIWQDPFGLYTTLFLGIDPEEGFFVAADPVLHSPTKFFIRLEFKDEHAKAIKAKRWFAWERDRRSGDDHPIETLVGGTSESFLDLVRFERSALGLPPGDRQLLAEHPEMFAVGAMPATTGAPHIGVNVVLEHPLAAELGLSAVEVMELIAGARRLKMAVRGWVAEHHLVDTLSKIPGVTRCERLDHEGSPDVLLSYKGGPALSIECKNVLRKLASDGSARIDFQRTRASKADPCSRYYSPSDFDLVAGCLHAVTEKWEFRYILSQELPAHCKCPGKLTNNVRVDGTWRVDPAEAFVYAYHQGLGC